MLCTACNELVKPIVCIDIDGTLADYHGHFLRWAAAYCDRPFNPWYDGTVEMHEHMRLDLEEYRSIKLAYRQGGGKRFMPMVRGSLVLLALMQKQGAEVWLTTTRPYNRYDSTDPDTRHWLRKHQLPYDHLLYDDDKYATLAQIVDPERVVGVVDDLPYQVGRAVHFFPLATSLLLRTQYNRGIRWDGQSVTDLYCVRDKFTKAIEGWKHG